MARLLVLANEATAAQRRVYFHLVDATDGLTAETGEAGGQPQVSSDGGAWTNTGIGTLNAIGNGRYYADLTQTLVQTTGTLIETRYKSANTAECPGDSVQVVAFDPNDAQLGMSARLLGTTTVTNLNTIFDTDYASVYNTTAKCLLVQLDDGVTHGGASAVFTVDSFNVLDAADIVGLTLGSLGVSGTTTLTGAVSLGSTLGVTGATTFTGAISCLAGIAITQSTLNGAAISATGNGAGVGLDVRGGATGIGFRARGGSTSGNAIEATATDGHAMNLNASGDGKNGLCVDAGTNADAVLLTGNGVGGAIWAEGGANGTAVTFQGGATTGSAFVMSSVDGVCVIVDGNGANHDTIQITATGANGDGIDISGGAGGVGIRSSSLTITGATTFSGAVSLGSTLGVTGAVTFGSTFTITSGIAANITGNITGNLVGTVSTLTTYTGNTPQTGDAFARLGAPAGASVSADVAAIQADLPQRITKNTALAAFMFKMVLSSDHTSPGTGLTVTATRSLDGAAFASCANAASEVSNGWYKIDLAAADLNANVVALKFTAATADSRDITIVTQPT